ncbi:hypothetical protein [Herbaspirillum sp. RV1423]|uniref:hypothetical protein n=1 Tax=Herbaspirillum sp. RV1423 TaxID=1443993 RepID=UPI0004BCEB79|nr:hypothetical protein [Herbaspirillum sp. RV1423]
MNHLDILLPFGLPQAEMARDLMRECKAPALAMLLARSKTAAPLQNLDPFSRALPHEHWLAGRFGLTAQSAAQQDERGDSPSAAAAFLRTSAAIPAPTEGHWFILQPAHIHVARDHLVLTNIDQLELDDPESLRLFQSALPLFEEIGRTLLYADAATWLMRADDWAGLRTSSPQAASGRNIDIWMPEGPGELAWRKLQNEVQMQWFSESINEEREMLGKKPVNSLWIWGGAAATAAVTTKYQSNFNLSGWPQALAGEAQHSAGPDGVLAAPGEHGLLMLDALLEPGLTNEWGYWLQRMEALDNLWFAPLLQAVRDKRLDSLSLILTGQDKLLHLTATASSLRRFWIKPSLAKLAA